MSKKKSKALKTLEQAEREGLHLPIDATQWYRENGDSKKRVFPLNPQVSAARCDIVAEARRIADILESRPATPPEGVIYEHSRETLEASLALATAYISQHLKGHGNAQSDDTGSEHHEQVSVHGDDEPDAGASSDARGKRHHRDGEEA